MELQLIFVMETNKQTKSDWIYIKETIDRFYEYDDAHVKFSDVYMDGRGNYAKKKKEVESKIAQYKISNKQGFSKVIYCFDCDECDTRQEDKIFIQKVTEYCEENKYDFVWFYKDVEQTYVGQKVPDNQKKKVSAEFKKRKKIEYVNEKALMQARYKKNTSNIILILDSYLSRKSDSK